MTRIKLLFILCVILGNQAKAQMKMRALVSFDYSLGFATGTLNDFISDKAFDGFHYQWRYFKERDFSLGFHTGYNNFRKILQRDVYETDRGTVSAVQSRYFNAVPILLSGHYYLRSSHHIMPYIGGGIGGYILRYEKFYGVFPDRKTSFNFGFNPELGLVIPFKNSGIGLMLSGKYNYVFYKKNEIHNLNYFEVSAGLYFAQPIFDDPFNN